VHTQGVYPTLAPSALAAVNTLDINAARAAYYICVAHSAERKRFCKNVSVYRGEGKSTSLPHTGAKSYDTAPHYM